MESSTVVACDMVGEFCRREPTFVFLAIGADLIRFQLQQAFEGGLVLCCPLSVGVGGSSRHVDSAGEVISKAVIG